LAECQIGYFYLRGIGVEKDAAKAFSGQNKRLKMGIEVAIQPRLVL